MSEEATKETAVAPTPSTALATGTRPAGFDNLGSDEFATPVYKLWHPSTRGEEVEGGKLGQYYDVNSRKAVSDTIECNVLALRNVSYENEEKDGTKKTKHYKHLLVLEQGATMPKILNFSVSAFRSIAAMMTTALEVSTKTGGSPLFAIKVTVGSEVTENADGKFAVPTFKVSDKPEAGDRFDLLAGLYEQLGKTFDITPAAAEHVEDAA